MNFKFYISRVFFLILLLVRVIVINAQETEKSPLLDSLLISAVDKVADSKYSESFVELNKLLELAEKQKEYKYVSAAKLNIGIIYSKLSDHEKALNYYLQSLDVAKTHSIESIYNSIYNNIGTVYSQNEQYEKALDYFNRAYEISLKRNNEFSIGINLTNIANVNWELKKYDESFKNLNDALAIFKINQDSSMISIIYNNLADSYFLLNDYKGSKLYIEKALKYSNINNKYNQSAYLLNLGRYCYSLNQFDSSIVYLQMSLKYALDINNKDNIVKSYALLSNNYYKKHDNDKTYEFLNKSNQWKDSILIEKKREWVSEIQMKYEFNEMEDEVKFLERSKRLQNIIWLLSSIGVITFLLFFIYSLRTRTIKAKQRNTLLLQEKKLLKLEEEESKAKINYLDDQIKTKEKLNVIKENQYKLEISYKNRELSSKALDLVANNKSLAEIKSLVRLIDTEDLPKAKKGILELKRLIDNNLNMEESWDKFISYFKHLHKDFFKNLIKAHPLLTDNDIALAVYIILELQAKDIAKILGISPNSVQKRKQRFVKKCNLPNDTKLINEYLQKYLK